MFPFEGFYEVGADGERTGYGYDLLQLMAQHANLTYAYTDGAASWGEMETMLLDGRLDLLTCVQKTPENEARFAFSDEAFGTSYTMMTVRAGNNAVVAGDTATYAGLRVGVIRDNSHAEKFAGFAARQGFSYTPVPYDSLGALEQALQAGAVDAAVTSSLRPLRSEWIVEQFDPSPYYLMLRRNDSDLLSRINEAVGQLDVAAPNWRTELYNRYYTPDSGEDLQLSAAERAYLAAQAGTVLRAAVCPDNAPYSYFEDGEAKGILPEIFAEIARRAGIRWEAVPCSSRSAYQSLLDTGSADLVIGTGWDYSAAEKKGYKLTGSYISLSLARLTRIGDSGEIKTAAVPEGTIPEKLAKTPLAEQYELSVRPTVTDTVKAVASGACDSAILYYADAQQYLANDIRSRLRVSLLPDAEVDISIGVAAKNDYLLLSLLSKSAESVRNGFVQDTVLRHTAGSAEHIGLLDYLYLNPVWGLVIAAVTVLLLFALSVIVYQRVWYRRQKRLSASLQAAKQEADEANAAKSAFLSSMSHDLRTPLNGILGFTDLAVREASPEKKQEYLLKIRSSGELLMNLVNDTLELSRIESGKLTLQPEAFDGRALIETVATAVRPSAEQKGIRLLIRREEIPAELLWGDRSKLEKIVLNLLSNAVKYTLPGGSIALRVSALEPPQAGCTRRLVVEDTGIGMSEEFLKRIYEPFAQEHRPEAEGAGGTGLGLSIVKRMVDFLGGAISVESRVGQGTRFTVDLPLETAAAAAEKPAGQEPEPFSLAGCRILLCEDNPVNTEIAALQLRELGAFVDCARNGQEGAERFAASPAGQYDAVLMDIRMPVLDGVGATRLIRAMDRPDAAAVPILAMTADAFEDDVRRCLDAGMNGHLAKPVDPQLLRRALEDAVRRYRGAQPPRG